MISKKVKNNDQEAGLKIFYVIFLTKFVNIQPMYIPYIKIIIFPFKTLR